MLGSGNIANKKVYNMKGDHAVNANYIKKQTIRQMTVRYSCISTNAKYPQSMQQMQNLTKR